MSILDGSLKKDLEIDESKARKLRQYASNAMKESTQALIELEQECIKMILEKMDDDSRDQVLEALGPTLKYSRPSVLMLKKHLESPIQR